MRTASSDQAGVLEVLEPEGYSLLVGRITDEDLRRPRDLRILRQRQVDGLILEGPTLPPPFVQELYNMRIPLVHVDGTEGTARIDTVLHDNEGGCRRDHPE